jgi:hypothetical protein
MKKLLMMIGAAAVVGAMLPLSAMADAVRVYDVDDYVQDGLVAHFDGIRNAGADAAHNASATTWKNLVDGKPDMAFVNSPGAWYNGNSYYFNQVSQAYGQLESGVTLGQYATIQLAVDVTANEQYSSNSAYPTYFYGPNDGAVFSLYSQGRKKTIIFRGGHYFNGSEDDKNRPNVDSWGGQYLTAILGDGMDYAFEGVLYSNGVTRTANAKSLPEFRYMFGGFDTANRAVKGAYYNVRLYNKVLSEAEIALNRAVDDARYRNAASKGKGNDDMNVIVASNVEGVEGTEASGKWYIAEGTHTFTAPATKVFGARFYTLSGYTVETWDGSAWGAAVTNSGASYTASSSAKVRLTWLWTLTLRGAADYDVDDYVQDGLVVHFDGIRNAGADAAHDPSAATWKNLVADKPDMSFVSTSGAWTNGNSYCFNGTNKAYGQLDEPGVALGELVTVQIAADIDCSDQPGDYPTYFHNPTEESSYSIFSVSPKTTVRYRGGRYFNSSFDLTGWEGKYLTAISGADTLYLFQGAEYANSMTRTTTVALPAIRYTFGGFDKDKRQVKGSYYSVRLYTNTLDNAQLAQNRRVDEIRFHGNGDVTVVNGTIGDTGANGESSLTDGVYNIEAGTWTITAPEIKSGGHTYQPKLLVEMYNATTGEWGATTARPMWTNSYTIDKATLGDNRIRLTWTWQIRKGFIISFF